MLQREEEKHGSVQLVLAIIVHPVAHRCRPINGRGADSVTVGYQKAHVGCGIVAGDGDKNNWR